MQGLWLYLRFNALQLSHVVDENGLGAEQASHPIAVYCAHTNQLCQMNAAAAQAGLTLGIGLAAASALCAELDIIEYEPEQETKLLHSIAEQLYGVTADISLDHPNGLYLRVDNMLKLYGSVQHYWQTLQRILQPRRFNYACAYSISAVKVLAKAGYNNINANPNAWKKALCGTSLSYCELTHKQIDALNRVGIQSFKQLFEQPVSALAARFDGEVLRYLSQLKGERFEQLALYRPSQKFYQHSELLYEITHSERLLKPLANLLKHLESYLVQRGLVAFDINIDMQLRDKQNQRWQLHSPQGESRATAWQEIAAIRIEHITLTAPVQGISLSAQQLSPAVAANDDLFAGKRQTMNALQLLARLQAKLGSEAIAQVQRGDDFRPEYINRWLSGGQVPCITQSANQAQYYDRPTFLLSQPQPLSEPSKILTSPERLATGWWDDAPVERDYFIAQNPQGQYLWVFRTADNQWFVQGYFA
ncbi:Y-family DNA polymerase [Alteromonas oceanisediminis]|uniref:Y-family DNA polymerase n=1 Tax=Alteromonas oceanisediminis TaxID=2836180 RepID=UPI001BDB38D2|nr:DNA polymerase Y family protein [Alteromonas oceanisediminis]MBT0586733.1 DNA polymerase Y family protein [Alteromonas oceanisediminis]